MARSWKSSFFSSGWLMVIMVTWPVLAPAQLGGGSTFIVISGSSMEPSFHTGDLAIVRQQASYQTGDIVAYRNPELGNNLFHRIIGQDQDRLVLKGDNNTWIDSYEPLPEDVIGGLWLAVPGAGAWIRTVRRPINMAVLVGALAVLIGIGAARERPKSRRMLKKMAFRDWMARHIAFRLPARDRTGGGSRGSLPLPVETLVFILGLIFFASLAIGIVGFVNPATKQAAADVRFEHLGFYSYSAAAPPGVYDAGGLKTGEPIFPRITCDIDLRFQYTLVGALPGDTLAGSHRIMALIAEPTSGWQRTIQLQPETPFTGSTFSTHATFNVCQAVAMIDEMEGQTGFHPGIYAISLRPEVKISATMSGSEVEDTFQPQLEFAYDRSHLYIVRDDPQVDPLMPAQPGSNRTYRTVPNTVEFLGLDVSVPAMRVASILGLLLSAAGFIWMGRYWRQLQERDPQGLVQAKYGSLVLEVRDAPPVVGSRIVQVMAIDDLAKLAEKNGSSMLHDASDPSSYYVVDMNGITYRCTLGKRDDAKDPADPRPGDRSR